MDSLTGDAGEFIRPEGAGGGAGQAAVDAFRRGEDPAALLAGRKQTPGPAASDGREEELVPESG